MPFAAWFVLPLESWMRGFQGWIDDRGSAALFVFGAFHVVATVLLVPGSGLTLAAGLAFGLWGFPLVIVSVTVGAVSAFLVARYLGRSQVQNRFGEMHRGRKVELIVAAVFGLAVAAEATEDRPQQVLSHGYAQLHSTFLAVEWTNELFLINFENDRVEAIGSSSTSSSRGGR